MHTPRQSFRGAVALAAMVALLAGACGSDADDDGTNAPVGPDEPVTLTLLTHDSFAVSEGVLEAFEQAEGVTVEVLQQGDAGAVVNQAALTKDNPVADVLYGVDNTFLARALDEEIFTPYRSATAAPDTAALGDLADPDGAGTVTPIDYGDVCLNYDLAWFAERDLAPPASLADLVDPDYAGLLVTEDAATSSPGLAFLLATIDELGNGWQDWWRALVANDVLVVDGWEQAYNEAFSAGPGAGDRPIVVSYGTSPPADVIYSDPPRDRPNIGVVDDACFRQVEYAGVLAGTDHPDEARALVDFMASERFQRDLPLTMFVFPARRDVRLDPVFARWAVRAPEPVRMDVATIGDGRDEWIDQWSELIA